MPGTPDTPKSAAQNFVDFDEYVDYQLEKTRSHIKQNDIFTTLAWVGTAFIAYLLAFVVLDQWVIDGGFGYRPRLVMLSLLVSILAAVLGRRVVWPLLKQVHPLYAARVIEKAEPALKSNLLNYVDLRETEQAAVAAPVARAIEKRAAVALTHVDVDQSVDRRPLLHVLYLLLGLVVLGALYIVFSPKDPFSSVKRALLPAAPIEVATETTVSEITPGDVTVPARSQVIVEADVRGRATDRVQILYTTNDHKYVDQPVEMRRIDEKLPRFRGTLNGENGRGLLQSLTYRIEAGDARTRDFEIEVIQPPSVRIDSLKYVPPSYTELPTREQTGGDIDGWEGTVVTFSATANMPLKSAKIQFFDTEEAQATGEELTMQIRDGTKLSAEWKLALRHDETYPKFYAVQCAIDSGETDPEPLRYTIRIRPDQRPEVVLLAPTADMQKEANAIVPLDIQATDPDFKIRSLWLKAERNGQEVASEQLFQNREQNGTLGQSIRGSHDLRLSNLRDLRGELKEGDVVHFWIEARDNKQPIANRASTPKLKIDIIAPFKTQEEVQKDLAKAKEEQQQQLARAEEAQNPDRQPMDPQNPPDAPQPGEPPRPNETGKPDDAARPPEKPADDVKQPGEPDPGQRRRNGDDRNSDPQQPEDFESALQKLLQRDREQREQQEQQPGGKSGNKSADQRADDSRGDGQSGTVKKRPNESRPSDSSDTRNSDKPNPSGDKRTQDKPPAGEKPADKDKSGESDKQPRRGSPSNDDSRNAKPGDKPGDDEKSPDKTAGDSGKPEKPAGDKTEGDKQPGDKTTKPGDKPADDKTESSGDPKKPEAGEKKPGDKAAGDKTANEKPGDKPAGDKPSEEKSPGDKTAGDKTAGDKPASDNPKSEKPAGDKTAGDKTGDKSDEGKTGEKTPSDKQPAADQAAKPDPMNSDPEKGDDKRGTPDKSKKPMEAPKPGDGGDGENPGDPNAKSKSSKTGDDSGMAEGDPDGDLKNAERAKQDLQKKPDSKQGKTGNARETDTPPPNSKQHAKPAPMEKNESPQPGPTDDPSSDKSDDKPQPPSQSPGDAPDAGNDKPQGKGRPGGQKSDQPQNGEEGNSAGSDQGQKGGNQKGAGDKSSDPGDSDKANGEKGKPGGKKGSGDKSKESDSGEKAGNKSGEGSSKSGSSQSGGESSQPGSKSGGSQSSQSTDARSEGTGASESPAGAASERSGSGINGPADGDADSPSSDAAGSGGEGDSTPRDEKANLEHAKKATNLVLDHLKRQLERGEVDEDLLKELGWSKADLERFTKQLEERLKDTGEDNSPEAVARRLQFEETLKSMRLDSETTRRQGSTGSARTIRKFDTRDSTVPPEYREQWEAYTRSLSKRKPPAANSAKPAPRAE
jgi:collagen type III alpha